MIVCDLLSVILPGRLVAQDMLEELAPSKLTLFLYDLSEKFNSFYVECKVIGSEEEESRLMLVESTAVVMRQCLSLLGIQPLFKI